MNRTMGSLLLVCIALVPAGAHADENLPISIITAPDRGDPFTITLWIQSPDVAAFDVESTFLSHGEEIGPPALTSVSLSCSCDGRIGVVPSPQGLVQIANAPRWSLAPGLYAESIVVRAQVLGYDLPKVVSGFRYFEVTPRGTRAISMSEYSSRTLPATEGYSPDGGECLLSEGGGAVITSLRPDAVAGMAESHAHRSAAIRDDGEDVQPLEQCDRCDEK